MPVKTQASNKADSPKESRIVNAGHPLFPLDEGKGHTQGEIAWIYVERNGQIYPEAFAADELQDYADISSRWGGGAYFLRARDSAKARWTGSHRVVIPGAPKSFAPPAPVEAESAAPRAAVDPTAGMLQFVLAQSQQSNQQMMQLMASTMSTMATVVSAAVSQKNGVDPAMVEIVRGVMSRADANPSDPVKMAEAISEVWQAGAEWGRGASEGHGEERGGELGQVTELLQGAMKMAVEKDRRKAAARAAHGPPPPLSAPADPVVFAVSEGRRMFGAACEGLSDEEIALRYMQARFRAERPSEEPS